MYFRRIKELREDKDIKQIIISNYLGIKQNSYSQLENGKCSVTIENLINLAIFYNTSIDYLVRANKSKFALSSYEFRAKKISPYKKDFTTFYFYFVQC